MRYHHQLGATPIIATYQASSNPGAVQALPTHYKTFLVLAALGGVGYLVYRHFRKSKHVTVSHETT